MARTCPIDGHYAIYLDCQECEHGKDREAKGNAIIKEEEAHQCCEGEGCKQMKYNTICIGIDQSYKRTGMSMSADGKLLAVRSVDLSKLGSKTEKREELAKHVDKAIKSAKSKAESVVIILEHVRTFSQNFISTNYIKSMGALNSAVVDTAFKHDVEVYNVDTRCWKATVLGSSKPQKNKFGVPEEKWPCVKWVIANGFENSVKLPVQGRRTKGTFVSNGERYEYDNDACDSAAMSQFWFLGDPAKLQLEG